MTSQAVDLVDSFEVCQGESLYCSWYGYTYQDLCRADANNNCICNYGTYAYYDAFMAVWSCRPCPSNQYQDHTIDIATYPWVVDVADESCQPCPEGSYSMANSAYCRFADQTIYPVPSYTCPEGQYPEEGSCHDCNLEFACSQFPEHNDLCTLTDVVKAGDFNCMCNVGTEAVYSWSTLEFYCSPCPANTYQDTPTDRSLLTGSTTTNPCKPCGPNSESAEKSSSCTYLGRSYTISARVRLAMSEQEWTSAKETQFRTAVAATTKSSVDAVTVVSVTTESSSLRRMLRRLLSSTLLVEFEVTLSSYDAAGEAGIRLQQSYFNTDLNQNGLPTAEFVSAPGFKDVDYTVLNCTVCEATHYLDQTTEACAACPDNSRTELTLHATDISHCVCEEGYTNASPDTCSPCAVGNYKDTLGNVTCTQCPATFSTLAGGADAYELCVCEEGFARSTQEYVIDDVSSELQVVKGRPTVIRHSGGNPIIITMDFQWVAATTNTLPYVTMSGGATTVTVPTDFAGTLYYYDGSVGPEVGYIAFVDAACTACAENLFKDFVGDEKCSQCPQHMYSDAGADELIDCQCDVGYIGAAGGPCEACEPGTFKSNRSASICDACPTGTYNELAASTSSTACLQCHENTDSAAGSGSIYACICDAGYSSVRGETRHECTPCAPGTFQTAPNSSTCTLCEAGKFSGAEAATTAETCQICAAGSTAIADGTVECTLCAESTYQDTSLANPTAQPCSACPPFSIHSLSGSTDVFDCNCARGYYRVTVGDSFTCEPCTAGFFCPGSGDTQEPKRINQRIACAVNEWSYAGATECTNCTANSESLVLVGSTGGGLTGPDQCQCNSGFTGTGDVGCTACAPGSFQSVDMTHDSTQPGVRDGIAPDSTAVSLDCQPCATGTYQDASAQTACNACPSNSDSAEGSDAITDCQCVQTYVGADGGPCELCSVGYFCPGGETSTQCRLHSSSAPGAGSETDCQCIPGFYSTAEGLVCNTCPENSYCPGHLQLVTCAGNSESIAGSDDISDCSCVAGMWRGCIETKDGRFLQSDGTECVIDYTASCELCGANDICVNNTLLHCPIHSTAPAGSSETSACVCNPGYYNAAHNSADHDHSEEQDHEHA